MEDPPPPPTFDLPDLALFLAVAEHGGMTAAARDRGLTQPAVSQAIRRLETRLGGDLLDRRCRPFALTPAGAELARRARALLRDADRAQTEVRALAAATLPRVRLGLIDSFAATAGPGLVAALRPHASDLIVWSGISPTMAEDLMRRRLDVMVTSERPSALKDLRWRALMTEPFILLLPKALAQVTPQPRLEDLAAHHPFVRYSERSRFGARIERDLRARGLDIPRAFEFDGTEAVFAMVAGGLGWAVTTPLCLIHGRVVLNRVRALPLPGTGPAPTRTLYAVGRDEADGAALVDRVARHARDVLARLTATQLGAIAPWVRDQVTIAGD